MKLSPRYKKSLSAVFLVALPVMMSFAPLSQVVLAQESGANLSLVAQTDRQAEADRLLGQGIKLFRVGKYRETLQKFEQALLIFREIKDLKGEAPTLNNIGSVYTILGQYQKAIAYHQQSLPIQKQIGDREGEGSTLNNLGGANDYLGKYQKAIEFYRQALAIHKQIGNRRGEAKSLNNLGGAYDSLGQYQKAIEFYQQSLALKKQLGDRNSEGTSLNNIGFAYSNLGQYQKAIEYYQQHLAIAKQNGDRNAEGTSLNNLGGAYNNLGQSQKAIEYYQQSLAIKKQIGERNGEGSSLNNLGGAYSNLGQYQKAIEYYQQSLAIKKQIGDRNGEGTALNNLGTSFAKLNQPELAILFYKQSINVRESIRKDILGLSKDEQKSYLDTIEKDYRVLADLLLKQGRVMEALQVLDLLKVQELEDYLKNIKGSDRTAQGVRILEPEKALSGQLSAISFEKSADINRQLASQLKQLPTSEINKVPDYLNQIPQGSVLLYPLILKDRLEIILFSPNTLPISRTVNISKDKLEELIKDYRKGLLNDSYDTYKIPATELYNLVIKPIEAELVQAKATTILYAPDGQLRYVPLAALYDGKQFLIEKYQISNLIAYSLSDFSPKPKNQPNILAGAFGGRAGEMKFGQNGLPATIKEVQAIASSFQNSVTLTEEKFSRQAIEAKFKNHNILHLATHAEFNTGAPDNSFIIFGNGDKIRLSEITDWQIPNIDLIVLSACQTGEGKLGDGVEILGFGYQVQKAGAKTAIASLWKVDDEGTQALMQRLYESLRQENMTSSKALQQAMIAMINSDRKGSGSDRDLNPRAAGIRIIGTLPTNAPKLSHPSYWSAFILIGNGL